MNDIGFEHEPEIPPPPTPRELNDFFVMCAEVMRGQPTAPLVMALKGGISIIVAQSAEIERLRVANGEKPTSYEEAAAILDDFLGKASDL